MSVEIVLIPLAIAITAATQSYKARSAGASASNEMHVESRMRDGGLLAASLQELGAVVRQGGDDVLLAETAAGGVTMSRNAAGLWTARFPRTWAPERARAFIEDLDRTYGLQVQQAVIRRLQERAPQAGMRVTSQSVDDDRVFTLVMEVEHE